MKEVYGFCKGGFVCIKVRCWHLDCCVENEFREPLPGQGSVRGLLEPDPIVWGRDFFEIGTYVSICFVRERFKVFNKRVKEGRGEISRWVAV